MGPNEMTEMKGRRRRTPRKRGFVVMMMRNRDRDRPEMGDSREVLIRGCSGPIIAEMKKGAHNCETPRVLLRRRTVVVYRMRLTGKGRAGPI
jgi:hypothetical protein